MGLVANVGKTDKFLGLELSARDNETTMDKSLLRRAILKAGMTHL